MSLVTPICLISSCSLITVTVLAIVLSGRSERLAVTTISSVNSLAVALPLAAISASVVKDNDCLKLLIEASCAALPRCGCF